MTSTRRRDKQNMEWIDNVLRDVAELPDRNSPEDWPEAMLVTGAELRQIIVTHAPAEAQQDVPEEAWDDIKLAEMIMSDCGFSSRYAPLKERIAKRIAKHVAAKTNPQAKGD